MPNHVTAKTITVTAIRTIDLTEAEVQHILVEWAERLHGFDQMHTHAELDIEAFGHADVVCEGATITERIVTEQRRVA